MTGNPNRPPPHLKGREIGLWHARKQKERKGLSGAAGAAVAAQEPGKILTKADKAYIQQHSSVRYLLSFLDFDDFI